MCLLQISLSLSCLSFTQLLESVGLYFLSCLGNSNHYYFKYFSALFSFSSPLGFGWQKKVRSFLIVPQVLWDHSLSVFVISFLFSVYPLDWVIFYCFIFKFTDPSLCPLHSAIKPIHWVMFYVFLFLLIIVFSNSQVSICFFFMLLILCFILILFFYFSSYSIFFNLFHVWP